MKKFINWVYDFDPSTKLENRKIKYTTDDYLTVFPSEPRS